MIADKRMMCFSNFFIAKHLAIAPWLVDELKEKGVVAEFYQNPVPKNNYSIVSLPKDFTILAYLGYEDREGFYGKEIIDKLIENYPAKFIVLGSKQSQKNEKVSFLGNVDYRDMAEIYVKSTVLVRITDHDGFSNMVQEALLSGRYVIWSKRCKYSIYADTYDDVVKRLNFIYKLSEPNYLGADNYNRDFNENICAGNFIKLYSKVLK